MLALPGPWPNRPKFFTGGIRSSRLSFQKSVPVYAFSLSFMGMRNLDWVSRKPAGVPVSGSNGKRCVKPHGVFSRESAARLADPRVFVPFAALTGKKCMFEIESHLVRIVVRHQRGPIEVP